MRAIEIDGKVVGCPRAPENASPYALTAAGIRTGRLFYTRKPRLALVPADRSAQTFHYVVATVVFISAEWLPNFSQQPSSSRQTPDVTGSIHNIGLKA